MSGDEPIDVVDTVVVGAGVVGLACARALALAGHEVLVLEREDGIGMGTSSRNSEVIHAGIYYDAGSAKARYCVHGRQLLYEYCTQRGIAHRRLGKLIVATTGDEHPGLEKLHARARANGVDDLRWLDAGEVRRLEPELRCTAALHSPSSGIVDSHALMLSLQGDLERAGGTVVLRTEVERVDALTGRRDGARWRLHARSRESAGPHGGAPVRDDDAILLGARRLVNAAGLHAVSLAHRIDGVDVRRLPRASYAKGHYFSLVGRSPFSHLVYPMPPPGGLGVHLTLDLAGQARFGPDVEWLPDADPDGLDYAVDARRLADFEREIRRYWPGLASGRLQPAYSGVRPKISGPGEPPADFRIDGPAQHGVPGLVHLLGIESPGLTASLSIAQEVVRLLSDAPAAGPGGPAATGR